MLSTKNVATPGLKYKPLYKIAEVCKVFQVNIGTDK